MRAIRRSAPASECFDVATSCDRFFNIGEGKVLKRAACKKLGWTCHLQALSLPFFIILNYSLSINSEPLLAKTGEGERILVAQG